MEKRRVIRKISHKSKAKKAKANEILKVNYPKGMITAKKKDRGRRQGGRG